MYLRLLLPVLCLAFVACTTSTGNPIGLGGNSSNAVSSSSDKGSSSSSSLSSGAGSSSSFVALPDVDSSLVAGPADLKVSSLIGPKSLVLTWTDVPSLPHKDYLGYQIYRNDNYSGWKLVGTAVPQKEFYKDTTLGATGEYKYLYKIIAFDSLKGDTTYVSKFSNEAGTLPITELGFKGVVFDEPSNFTATRWSPSWYRFSWSISALKPELGVVVQKLAFNGSNPDFVTGGVTYPMIDSLGDWVNLDTLGENDNHFDVQGPNSGGTYRIYAFYSDEFGRVWSEFSPEISTREVQYHSSIVFTPPVVYTRVIDNTSIVTSWVQTHNNYLENVNVYKAVDDLYSKAVYEIEETVGANDATPQQVSFSKIQTMKLGLSLTDLNNNLCAYSVRIRVVWTDKFNVTDKTSWSNVSGTVSGATNLADPGQFCPK